MRYFCFVAYDGTPYHGWQSQKNALSVQQVIEEGISTVLRSKISITGSGRTDTGVHATEQVFHFDFQKELNEDHLFKFNSILPREIAIHDMARVNDDAHARFDAVQRSYQYVITRRKNPFLKKQSYLFTKELNIEKMDKACIHLLKQKDFQSFSRVKTDVNNFLCELTEAYWEERNEMLVFHVSSNRFLRGMVRAMVGTLLDVGTGKTNLGELKSILKSRDRKEAGRAVPAEGLFLTKVEYPDQIFRINP